MYAHLTKTVTQFQVRTFSDINVTEKSLRKVHSKYAIVKLYFRIAFLEKHTVFSYALRT